MYLHLTLTLVFHDAASANHCLMRAASSNRTACSCRPVGSSCPFLVHPHSCSSMGCRPRSRTRCFPIAISTPCQLSHSDPVCLRCLSAQRSHWTRVWHARSIPQPVICRSPTRSRCDWAGTECIHCWRSCSSPPRNLCKSLFEQVAQAAIDRELAFGESS